MIDDTHAHPFARGTVVIMEVRVDVVDVVVLAEKREIVAAIAAVLGDILHVGAEEEVVDAFVVHPVADGKSEAELCAEAVLAKEHFLAFVHAEAGIEALVFGQHNFKIRDGISRSQGRFRIDEVHVQGIVEASAGEEVKVGCGVVLPFPDKETAIERFDPICMCFPSRRVLEDAHQRIAVFHGAGKGTFPEPF